MVEQEKKKHLYTSESDSVKGCRRICFEVLIWQQNFFVWTDIFQTPGVQAGEMPVMIASECSGCAGMLLSRQPDEILGRQKQKNKAATEENA